MGRSWVVIAAAALCLAGCTPGGGDGGADGADAVATTATTAVPTFAPVVDATPVAYPDQPEGVAWPTEAWEEGPLPPGVDEVALDAHLDRAFGELSSDGFNTTDAVLVVQGGTVVVERYRAGFGDADTTHRSWSMAKSITHALVGILVAQGRIDVYEPTDVPQWQEPGDPRGEITTDQLLRMASGLEWNEDYYGDDSDTIAMLAGEGSANMAAYAADKPLEVPPDSRVRYATGTSNIVAGIIGRIVGTGDAYERFIDDELLDPIGIDLEATAIGWDDAGQVVGGSIFDLTARDYARFGLLYLRGGTWDGVEIVPEPWVDYGRTPTPAPAGSPEYGAHWWTYDECAGGFRAGGFNGQHIVICPDLDLVVVVLSNRIDFLDGEVRDGIVYLFRDADPAVVEGAEGS